MYIHLIRQLIHVVVFKNRSLGEDSLKASLPAPVEVLDRLCGVRRCYVISRYCNLTCLGLYSCEVRKVCRYRSSFCIRSYREFSCLCLEACCACIFNCQFLSMPVHAALKSYLVFKLLIRKYSSFLHLMSDHGSDCSVIADRTAYSCTDCGLFFKIIVSFSIQLVNYCMVWNPILLTCPCFEKCSLNESAEMLFFC